MLTDSMTVLHLPVSKQSAYSWRDVSQSRVLILGRDDWIDDFLMHNHRCLQIGYYIILQQQWKLHLFELEEELKADPLTKYVLYHVRVFSSQATIQHEFHEQHFQHTESSRRKWL
jgi:hypothetical protein